jgi:Tfp pilus assembly protein FimT
VNGRGLSIVELLASLAILGIVVAVFATASNIAGRSMTSNMQSLEVTSLHAEIASNLQNSFALGAGYVSAGAATAANSLDPDLTTAQPVTLLDAGSGLNAAYTAFAGSNATLAPATARIDDKFLITGLNVIKKNHVTGAGDVGSTTPQIYTNPTTAVVYERRAIFADLEINLKNLRAARDITNLDLGGDGPLTFSRRVPITVVLERPQGGGTWKAAKTGSAEGLAFNIGWRELGTDCADGVMGAGGKIDCPAGMFIVGQNLSHKATQTYGPCGCSKWGCWGSCLTSQTAATSQLVKCCKVR